MGNPVIDDRLRAARPPGAHVDADAFDPDLLARLQRQPVAPRRSVPRRFAIPLATAAVTLAAAAAVMFAGGPGDIGGPSSASAIEQALHWLNPPAGTVLHVRSVETSGDRTITTRESWHSADTPSAQREVFSGQEAYEIAGDGLYDPATNTIYDREDPGKSSDAATIAADPVVQKVRFLLADGRMTVTGRERHNGQDAWAISLKEGLGNPVWTLWVSAADGKPLELQDPGGDARKAGSVIRWETYEVLDDGSADQQLTLRGAHPTATVVNDPAQVDAFERRLFGQPDRRVK
jgi:hypothetical protein